MRVEEVRSSVSVRVENVISWGDFSFYVNGSDTGKEYSLVQR